MRPKARGDTIAAEIEEEPDEKNDPGKLELFVEPNDGNLVDNANSLTVAS